MHSNDSHQTRPEFHERPPIPHEEVGDPADSRYRAPWSPGWGERPWHERPLAETAPLILEGLSDHEHLILTLVYMDDLRFQSDRDSDSWMRAPRFMPVLWRQNQITDQKLTCDVWAEHELTYLEAGEDAQLFVTFCDLLSSLKPSRVPGIRGDFRMEAKPLAARDYWLLRDGLLRADALSAGIPAIACSALPTDEWLPGCREMELEATRYIGRWLASI